MEKHNNPKSGSRQVPMIVTTETASELGLKPEDIVWHRIGNRNFRVFMVDANDAIYKAYIKPVWKKIKQEERDNRCFGPGKNGGLIRCPESNKCEDCAYYPDVVKEMNRSVPISSLIGTAQEPVAAGSLEDDVINNIILDDLFEMLEGIKKGYGDVFLMLANDTSKKETAEKIGVSERTVTNWVKKVRKIILPYGKELFDR